MLNLNKAHTSSLGAAFKPRLSRLAPTVIHCSCLADLPCPTISPLIQILLLIHRLACPWIYLIAVILPTKCWTVSDSVYWPEAVPAWGLLSWLSSGPAAAPGDGWAVANTITIPGPAQLTSVGAAGQGWLGRKGTPLPWQTWVPSLCTAAHYYAPWHRGSNSNHCWSLQRNR